MQRKPVNRRMVTKRKTWVQRRRDPASRFKVTIQGDASENTKRLIQGALANFEAMQQKRYLIGDRGPEIVVPRVNRPVKTARWRAPLVGTAAGVWRFLPACLAALRRRLVPKA